MKNIMDNKRISHIILFLIIFASIIVSLILIFDSTGQEYYSVLFLLPLFFAITCIFFIKIFHTNLWGIGTWMIILLYFVRNVITPLFMKLGNYASVFPITSSENINKAIILMIYETFVVFLTLYLCMHYYDGVNISKRNLNIKRINISHSIIFLLVVFCVVSYITIPEIRMTFNSIFNIKKVVGDNYTGASTNINYGGLKRIAFSLTIFIIPLLQKCLPIVFFIEIKKHYGEKRKAVILSILFIFLNFLMISDNNMDVFITAFILSMVLIRLYPVYEKLIIKIVGTVIIISIIAITSIKSDTSLLYDANHFATISKTFQAYFQGVNNVAGIFNIYNPSKIATLFFDFFDMIPFRNTLFNGLGVKGDRLVIVYCRSNYVVSQLIPCIGQAYHYLGFVLAPIIPAMLSYWAVRAQNRFRKEQNIFRYVYYLTLVIYLSFATAVNNFTIFGTNYLNLILPLYFISTLTGENCSFNNNLVLNKKYTGEGVMNSDEFKR